MEAGRCGTGGIAGSPQLDEPNQRGDLYAHVKLVLPDKLSEAQHEADLRELRRARRLRADLEHAAITIILRLRRRTVALQHEISQLRGAARTPSTARPQVAWSEAEWLILDEES